MSRTSEQTDNNVENNSIGSFAIVPTNDDEESIQDKVPKDLSWSNVNFRVKNKAILKECWERQRQESFVR
eukprot:gene12172-13310_t